MATAAKNPLLTKLQKMLPTKIPGTPPLPKREIIQLLKRMRTALDHLIATLEKEDRPPARRRAPAKKARAAAK